MPNQQNAKYAFYYLLSLVALVFMTLSVGMIAYGIIDKTIPDAVNYFSSIDSQLKFAISALFIATPIFYVLSWLIGRGLQSGELTKDSGIRRWLTYFILFISSLVVLGVLISVINVFLSGELTARFIWKALTVFVISAAVFAFYLYDIRRENPAQPDWAVKIFWWASLTIVLAFFVASWFFVESPTTARARSLDQALLNNISSLETAVNNYYDRYKKLPENLSVLTSDSSIYLDASSLLDPDTRVPIVYNKVNDRSFEFCATFRLDSKADNNNQSVSSYPGDKNHRAGYQCVTGILNSIPAKAAN
jgi:hypothetical protein